MRFAKVDKQAQQVSKHFKFETKDYIDMNFSGFKFASSKVDRCIARIRNDTDVKAVDSKEQEPVQPALILPGKTIDLKLSQMGRTDINLF